MKTSQKLRKIDFQRFANGGLDPLITEVEKLEADLKFIRHELAVRNKLIGDTRVLLDLKKLEIEKIENKLSTANNALVRCCASLDKYKVSSKN